MSKTIGATRQNKPGGVLHIDLTRAESRLSHAMMLVEDPAELRMLTQACELVSKAIEKMFGDAPRPRVGQ